VGHYKYEKTVAGGFSIFAAIKLIGIPSRQSSKILDFRAGVIGPWILVIAISRC
jgi:hypothetical protein